MHLEDVGGAWVHKIPHFKYYYAEKTLFIRFVCKNSIIKTILCKHLSLQGVRYSIKKYFKNNQFDWIKIHIPYLE